MDEVITSIQRNIKKDMKRTFLLFTLMLTSAMAWGQGKRSSQEGNATSIVSIGLQKADFMDNNTSDAMKIRVSDGTNTIVYELNETSAAKSLYQMLPLEVAVQDYGSNEKIFYPPTAVSHGADCIEGDCPAGTLALFSPWGNVVMYYGAASRYSGLYILGKAVDGAAGVRNLSGTIRVEAAGGASGVAAVTVAAVHSCSPEYTLNGVRPSAGHKGVVIKGGRKYAK